MLQTAPGFEGLRGLHAALRVLRDPRRFIDESSLRFGRLFTTRIPDGNGRLGRLFWMLGPKANERILAPEYKDDFTWYGGYRYTMEPIVGRDILVLLDDAPGCPAHRDRHRLLAPAFRPQLDAEYLPLMEEIVARRLDGWPRMRPFDLQAELKQISFGIVSRLFFGAADAEIPQLLSDFEEMGHGLFSILHVPLPGTDFWRALQAKKRLVAFLQRKIAQLRARGELSRSVLGQLLREPIDGGEPLPEATLISEMTAFLFVGYETTASLLASLFGVLQQYPAERSRLGAEARALPDLSPETLANAQQIDRALLEAERLFPPLVFNMRGVRRAFEFSGFQIPAGAMVAYSSYYTGRMAELWEAPLDFRPERFLGRAPAPYTMLAFGGGHRLCTGKRLARVEATLIMSAILRRFDVEILPHSDAMIFKPTQERKHGLPAQVRPIQN